MRAAAFIVACSSGALGCGGSATEAELPRPAYVLHRDLDLCGTTVAVDAEGKLWKEGGCENGSTRLDPNGTVTPEQYQRIAAAFAAHPDPATYSDPSCATQTLPESAHFTEFPADGAVRDWHICAFENGQQVYAPPFDKTAAAFGAL